MEKLIAVYMLYTYMLCVGMAMGQGGAEGWDLHPRPTWIFLIPSSPHKAPRRPLKPRPTIS